MMGRITALAIYEKDPCVWWAASASGGLLKTENNGVTFEHQFDDQATVSIGDVQVAQSDKNIVWVGTGESNPRNSVSWGDGVYKSTDGGKTWKNMGLKKTFQTGAIAIHPENPDVVYVGSLGRLWGPNKERGLFKTADGGKTWEKVLYVNDKTGIIDVQMNPKNHDELLVATYERQRDGFDGNDPMTKYGAGSGIYRTVDGGKSFEKVFKGLPSCNLGRIGLDYYRADPNYVFAIVESEMIAKEPEDSPFMGLRAEDADVGARITNVTSDGPCEKAGIKEGDIVVSVDGAIVHSYQNMLSEIRKKRAGDKVSVVLSRERKQIDVEVELAKKPKRTTRSRNGRARTVRTPFTGTLGGQAANLQGQQGENENEYGGVYMSSDGGASWERINTLNPRPMYYSHIRVDPTDRNNVYVCGTSLYKSKDGGKTFTGDGGSDGIHVDHHAMWIDPSDSRHIILGNDGGIYVTWDRMTHWDHHNHVAIGQFYHVGVDANLNYNVYGGLQDNGSWGGPSRSASGGGTNNSDWFRVGGGDGFITLVDPNDSDQIYFESQNGGMGRINLRTGERGFIRPRPPRGTRYRFNWKSPFTLSPHNSKVYYSAGNYVFRSMKKGDKISAISPEITNSDKGAGSAITESPAEPGVLYVGTTDGAVWMTKDGGKNWTPLFYQPEKKEAKESEKAKDGDTKAKKGDAKESKGNAKEKKSESKVADPKSGSGKTSDEKAADKKGKSSEESDKSEDPAAEDKADDDDPITGVWVGRYISDRIPEERSGIEFKLKMSANGKFSGEMENRRGDLLEFDSGKYDPKTGEISWVIESERGDREYTGTLKNGELTGEMSAGGGRFQLEFEAKRKKADPALSLMEMVSPINGFVSLLRTTPKTDDDPVSGTWKGVVDDDNLPGGRVEFSIELKKGKDNKLSGGLFSPAGDAEIVEGKFDSEKSSLEFEAENEDGSMSMVVEAKVKANGMSGSITINDQLEIDFEAEKEAAPESADESEEAPSKEEGESEKSESKAKPAMEEKASKSDSDDDEAKKSDSKSEKTDEKESAKEADETKEGDESKDAEEIQEADGTPDPVSGVWKGTLESPRGESEITMTLKRKSNKSITGTYETERGEGEITEGVFDPEKKQLSVLSDNGRFTLEFVGEVAKESFEGEVDFNGGQFSMDFAVKRVEAMKVAADTEKKSEASDKAETKSTAKAKKSEELKSESNLPELMPGPRWVSSLEASRFKAGRCYISFDGHRSNDDEPYLFATEDFGKTWKSIRGDLPSSAGCVRCLREDVKNQDLLYLGCEFSAWFSIDRGNTWNRFEGMPTVAVHEIAVHPTAEEIVMGTHGRSIWIADVSILRKMTAESVSKPAHLYGAKDVIRWRNSPSRGDNGTREFKGEDPASGVTIGYSLGKSTRNIELNVLDLAGTVVRRFDAPSSKGLHLVNWNLRRGSNERRGRAVPEGSYLIELRVDGERMTDVFQIKSDPDTPSDAVAEDEELEFWLEFEGEEGDDR